MKTLIVITFLAAAASAGAETLVLQPGHEGKDGFIYYEEPGTNYGYLPHLIIGNQEYYGECRTLIEWDISELQEDIVIESAEMGLFCYAMGGDQGQPSPIRVYRITEFWEENYVTWNSRPDYDGTEWVEVEWNYENSWTLIDIADYVIGWYTGESANYGLVGIVAYEGYTLDYRSSDYDDVTSQRPKLTIEYSEDPGDASVTPSSLGTIKVVYR
jgi:hypothetical protein